MRFDPVILCGYPQAEENLVAAVHDIVEKTQWTLAEDKLIRDALKAFAVANESVVRTGGPVKLSNGTEVSLDPEVDASFRPKRDKWLAQKLTAKSTAK